MRAAGYYRAVLLSIAAAGLVLELAALGPLRYSFWGFHLFAFVPRAAMWWGWILVAGAAAMFLFRGWHRSGSARSAPEFSIPAWTAAALAAVCAVLFWWFRSQQTLLGDGLPLTINLPEGQSFHPRQPLAMWIQQFVYGTFGGTLGGDVAIPTVVAHRTVALGSIVAGVMFVPAAFALGRCFARRAGRDDLTALLATLVILTQGYAVMFFGYVENYTYHALAIILYLLASVWVVQRRLPLAAAAVALVVAMGVHLSAVLLLPSFVFIVVTGLTRSDRRVDTAAGLAAFAAGVLFLDWLLGRLSPGFTLWGGVVQLFGVARETQGGGAGWSYFFSATHLRDFFNEQFLIGPLSAFLFVPALLFALGAGRRWLRDPVAGFLLLAAGVYLVGSFATSEPLLGYGRDWDLFAAAGVCFCAAAVYLVVSHTATPHYTRRLLAFALVLSLVHLAPWVAVNHSEAVALERFKTLPLGAGKTEVVVANYYMRRGRPADAESWFKRALKANPANVNAYFLLGVLYASNGHTETATQFIGRAVELRPNKADYRERYVQVLLDARRCREAVPQLEWLAARRPGDFQYWQEVGQRMGRLGCGDDLAGIYAPVFAEADRLLTSDPGDVGICLDAGILLGFSGRPADALEMYLRVLDVDPESPAALFNTGLVLFDLGRESEARACLEKFIALHPDHEMTGYARKTLSQ